MKAWVWFGILLSVCVLSASLKAADDTIESGKKALTPLQNYVGEWKGSGALKGDQKETFGEESDWAWNFKTGVAALSLTNTKGKFLSGGKIIPTSKEGSYEFNATLADGKTAVKYEGALNKDGELVLKGASSNPATAPAQITFSLVAKGNRMMAFYEKSGSGGKMTPLAEVGSTRKGSDFGKDTSGHECCITGGKGTSTVSYKGQTYYVCCSGCRESFNENPEKEIASYLKRKAGEKK